MAELMSRPVIAGTERSFFLIPAIGLLGVGEASCHGKVPKAPDNSHKSVDLCLLWQNLQDTTTLAMSSL